MSYEVEKKDQRVLDRINSYGQVFSTEAGKTVLYDLMEKGYFLNPTMAKDPYESARNEGQRELVLYILTQLNRDPKQVYDFIMQKLKEQEEYL